MSHFSNEKPGFLAYPAYLAATSALFAGLAWPAWMLDRHGKSPLPHLGKRLGGYAPSQVPVGTPRIWLHASSVGEVGAAIPVLERLHRAHPEGAFVLSAFTPQGLAHARRLAPPGTSCVYAPMDFVGAVRRGLFRMKPHVVAFLETEIWPNWMVQARRLGVKTALVNGRISERSLGGYLRFRPFFQAALAGVDAFSMISPAHAARIEKLGAPRGRIFLGGNAKLDLLAGQTDLRKSQALGQRLGLSPEALVLVAGSTRRGEEELVLEAFGQVQKEFPKAVLILAPRHVERAPVVEGLLQSKSLPWQRLTLLEKSGEKLQASVLLVDRMGDLFLLYGLASAVFCGASLVPLGGQNILEPAAWAKPVLHGPHMEDFAEARELLETAGGSATVTDAPDLARRVLDFFTHPSKARAMGKAARQAVVSQQGAADRHARVILDLLEKIELNSPLPSP